MSDTFTLDKAPEVTERNDPTAGVYDAEVVQVKREFMTRRNGDKVLDDDGQPIERVNFVFELTDPQWDYTGKNGNTYRKRVYGSTPTTFNDSPYCRLRGWVTEILAANSLPEGFSFSLADLEGSPVKVVLEEQQYDDKNAPRSAWVEDALTGEKVPPKKTSLKVQDVLRADSEYGNAVQAPAPGPSSMTMEQVADAQYADEPF